MESQYYTPTIEEFHVGFEFEMDAGTGWSKQTFPKPWWESGGMGGINTLKRCIEDKSIRVKHLDRQDIEECGWERDSTSSDWSAFNLKSESKYNHCLTIDVGSKKEIGKNIVIFNNDGVIFKGTIRNKSELRKIMNQCGISA